MPTNRRRNSIGVFIPIVMLILAALACVQDCMGITFSVEGYVVDEENRPIPNATIKAWDNGAFELPEFTLMATSGDNGYFDTDSVFRYGCEAFQVEVSAEGYATKQLTYFPPSGEGFSDELPDKITVQLQPISD